MTNEISYLEGDTGDDLNTDDYDVWSLGTAITFEIQDNNLVLVTSWINKGWYGIVLKWGSWWINLYDFLNDPHKVYVS